MFNLLRFTLSTELLRCDFYCDPSLLKEQKGYRISDWEIGSCLLKFEVVTSSQKYRVIVETTKVLTRFLSYINENIFQRGLGNHKKTIVTFFLFSIWLSAASAHMLKILVPQNDVLLWILITAQATWSYTIQISILIISVLDRYFWCFCFCCCCWGGGVLNYTLSSSPFQLSA